MRQQHQTLNGQQTRRDAVARVHGCDAFVATAHVAVVPMLQTGVTAKINPSWVSGGLPREGNS